jgi:hypothetical protein
MNYYAIYFHFHFCSHPPSTSAWLFFIASVSVLLLFICRKRNEPVINELVCRLVPDDVNEMTNANYLRRRTIDKRRE